MSLSQNHVWYHDLHVTGNTQMLNRISFKNSVLERRVAVDGTRVVKIKSISSIMEASFILAWFIRVHACMHLKTER